MIKQANATRSREAPNATTFFIINIRDNPKKPYLRWSTDPSCYRLAEKKSVCIHPFIDIVFFLFRALPFHRKCVSASGDLIRDQRSRISADHFDMLFFLKKRLPIGPLGKNIFLGLRNL
jgi:hypothetical protein